MIKMWMGWTIRETGAAGLRCIHGDKGKAYGLQFDYRYGLIPFMSACVDYNPERYGGFKPFIALGAGNEKLIYNAALGKLWQSYYDAYTAEFEQLQYVNAYERYYVPAAAYVKKHYGIDMDHHSPAVRGTLFSMSFRSGQEAGAKRFCACNDSTPDKDMLYNAYSAYGNLDSGRWTKAGQWGDALKALSDGSYTELQTSMHEKVVIDSGFTEADVRKRVVAKAESFLNLKEADGSHKKIIDIYNGCPPLPRGYKMLYNKPWCATFVSAVGISCGYQDIMYRECGCEEMVKLYQAAGRWKENDNYVPQPADIIMYDWDDDGKGDCKGWSDHTGFVKSVTGDKITLIEGNYHDSVSYRTITVGARYIRGYCLPDYARKATAKSVTPEISEQAPVSEKMYIVQAGSYTIEENARRQCAAIVNAGFDAYVAEKDGQYKIYAGAYTIQENANKQVERLKKAGFDAFWFEKKM